MATRVSQDSVDVEKFTKLFTQKTAQIIVQSRQGIKLQTKCNAPNITEWFNISVPDCAHVTEAIKKAIGLHQAFSFGCFPLCVEISLRTVEGEEMILEQWVLDINQQLRDPTIKVRPTVYNRMEMLLKSLISITRIMPAYKLSRKQAADSYIIQYHIYTGHSTVGCLGEDHKQIKIGEVRTPCSIIFLTLRYRTKMTMPTNATQKSGEAIMMKSDHFHAVESSENLKIKLKKEEKYKKIIDLNKPLRAGAFVDTDKLKELQDTLNLQLPPELATWLSTEKQQLEKKSEESHPTSQPDRNGHNSSRVDEEAACANAVGPAAGPSASIEVPKPNRFGAGDQKLLKVLNCPFADGSPITDLAQFYRDCINAPQLSDSLSEESECAESGDSRSTEDTLSRQLLMFESSVPEFDSVVASMYSSNPNNNNPHNNNN